MPFGSGSLISVTTKGLPALNRDVVSEKRDRAGPKRSSRPRNHC